ncbi:right-handed parallel beta-helix repeat-containing protein [Enterobacter hormaechei]|uniref:right-handed parallel beta-helix repeat-containing protein n=1 Tax=Enterobacter hormaechei TaxID=158836 RepID=UPI001E2C1B6B|nr:right-handed parallel beta-helix repeat-containing protein [Enterobacter hormaechei]
MTVSTVVDHNDYNGNGVTTTFPYTFRIFKKTDLAVSVVDLNENITALVLDTDYTVTNAGGYNGGNVVLTAPLANGWQISIARELEPTQETDLRNQGKFFAEVHEDAFDKLTMLIQQAYSVFRLALRKPSSIANWYDALGNYIRNVRDPRDAQDAATKNYVDSLSAGDKSYTDSLFKRTLRVPEDHINLLPSIEQRANKVVGFDSQGNPAMLLPADGSANDVLLMIYNSWLHGMVGLTGGEVFPVEIDQSAEVGMQIPAGVRFIRVNGEIVCMSSPLGSPVIISSIDTTTVNNGQIELYPVAYFDKVMAGWKIAQNDAQLTRLLPKAGNIYIGYSPVKVEGIFIIQGDIRVKPLLPKVTVDSRQFWLRSPRTWNEANQEFDYTPYDIRIVGNFLFDFYRQDASFDPGVGLAMQSAGTLELSGCELQGAWNSNVTMDYGRWSIADNLYSHDCGRGQIQQPDGSNRQGMAIIVGNPREAHVHHIRTRTTWASSVFIDAKRPDRTLNVMIHDISINGSGGNGLRLQSDDLVTGVGGGQGTAITRVNISGVTIKNCESHGIRANFTNGSVTGVYIESCNAGIAIEGSSDVTYDNIIIRNCSQGILGRFYPVVCTRLRFGNVLISGCTDWAIYFQAAAANTTVNLGDIEFDGVTIHCLASPAKAVFISCGANTTATSDITIKNLRVVGAFPDADGKAICQIYNARHIEVDNWNIRGVNGLPSSYLYAQASQSLNINRLVGVQPFGTVTRPIECVGVAGHVNIVNCSVPVTTNGILYTSTPASRYEDGNQFYNSAQPQQFPFTNAGALRGGDVNTLTTAQLANIVATLINDISLGKFIVR